MLWLVLLSSTPTRELTELQLKGLVRPFEMPGVQNPKNKVSLRGKAGTVLPAIKAAHSFL